MLVWKLMHAVKGTSSEFMLDHLLKPGDFFSWQDGYGAFSFSPSHKQAVIGYIQNQKQHHADGTLWPEVEKLPDDE